MFLGVRNEVKLICTRVNISTSEPLMFVTAENYHPEHSATLITVTRPHHYKQAGARSL